MGLGSSEWGPCCIRILDYAHFPNYIIIQVFAVRPHASYSKGWVTFFDRDAMLNKNLHGGPGGKSAKGDQTARAEGGENCS
eukprot:scaffold61381_cov33-Tisochrysis_lutea.AAC.7